MTWRTRKKGTKKQKGLKFQHVSKRDAPFKLKTVKPTMKHLKTQYEVEKAITEKGQRTFDEYNKPLLKRFAPTALMDVDRRAASRLERAPDTYKLEDVPISQINLRKAWNEYRYKDNLYYLRVTGGMPPVLLHFDEKTGKFNIEDGIHRIHAAKDLGYMQVPAIVAYVR